MIRMMLWLFLFGISGNSVAQEEESVAPPQEIIKAVQQWQTAHQQRDVKALQSLYAPKVDYYGQLLSSEAILKSKQTFFSGHPEATQVLVSEPLIESFENGGGYQARFVKQVVLKGEARNYPAELEFHQQQGRWLITLESDGITDYNLGRDNAVIVGRFSGGDSRQFAWLVTRMPESGGICQNDGEEMCQCELWNSDSRVPPFKIKQCIGGALEVMSGLDDSGRDRVRFVQSWWTSTWTMAYLLDVQKYRWQEAIPAFSTTWDDYEDLSEQLILPDPNNAGAVIVRQTGIDSEGERQYILKSQSLRQE